MTSSDSKLVAVLCFLLLMPLVYHITFVLSTTQLFAGSGGNVKDVRIANVVAGVVAVAGWIGLWVRHVRWSVRRGLFTLLTLILTAAVAVSVRRVYVAYTTWVWANAEISLIVAWFLWVYLWLGSTAFVWRESPWDRAKRLRSRTLPSLPCPKCRYNLAGLHEARCPECGTQYTLDELVLSASVVDSSERA